MLLAPLLLSSYASFALADALISDALSSTIATSLYAANVTGLQVAIIKNGSTQLKAWGNKTETGDPLTPDTIMNIGSCSKGFTSAAMGILMDDFEQKKNITSLPDGVDIFTWTTKIAALIPEWKLVDEWATKKADIHDLLSHSTGAAGHDFAYAASDRVAGITSRLRYLEPQSELRQNWAYNNHMYMVGQYIIEKYANTSFTSFVEERIMKPVGMSHSTYSPTTAAQSGNLAQSFNAFNRRIRQWFTEESTPMIAGAGGIFSSAADMLNWAEMLLNKGVVPKSNETVIPLSAYTIVTTPYATMLGLAPPVTYGMAWSITTYKGHEIIWHNGGLPGGSSHILWLPADGIAVVILTNGSDKINFVDALWAAIVDDLLGIADNSTEPLAVASPIKRDVPKPQLLARDTLNAVNNTSLDSFAGTYYNPGYANNFTLCTASSTSSICSSTISNFTAVDSAEKINSSAAVSLYASWPQFWSSHLRLGALNESSLDTSGVEGAGIFTFELTNLFPAGYGVDKSPFADPVDDGELLAQFAVDGESGKLGLRVVNLSGAGPQSSVLFERV